MSKKVIHQFSLFGYVPPKIKVPISAERIREVKAMIEKGDGVNAALKLREVREGLERFERGLFNRKPDNNGR
jgi:hypothetical protein